MLVQGSRPPAIAIALGASIPTNHASAIALSADHLVAVCKSAVGERRREAKGELKAGKRSSRSRREDMPPAFYSKVLTRPWLNTERRTCWNRTDGARCIRPLRLIHIPRV